MTRKDIREKPFITQEDILALDFIKDPCPYVFRRHYRSGLRSHIMGILLPEDVQREKNGVMVGGIRYFPRARPVRMLRIFRTRFYNLSQAEEEPRRVKLLESYLAPLHLARSDEFIVDYRVEGKRNFLLCGLQEYVEGEVMNPWRCLDRDHLLSLLVRMGGEGASGSVDDPLEWLLTVRRSAEGFIKRLKKMISDVKFIPDLAGVGNLILTRPGHIRLVDINNVSRVPEGAAIPLDDRGYPACDKSVEALSLLEQKLIERPIDKDDSLYGPFLDPVRMKEVRVLEDAFHLSFETYRPSSLSSYPLPD